MTNRAVAEQVRRAGMPAPRAIGIDEIAFHKDHDCRVVILRLQMGSTELLTAANFLRIGAK